MALVGSLAGIVIAVVIGATLLRAPSSNQKYLDVFKELECGNYSVCSGYVDTTGSQAALGPWQAGHQTSRQAWSGSWHFLQQHGGLPRQYGWGTWNTAQQHVVQHAGTISVRWTACSRYPICDSCPHDSGTCGGEYQSKLKSLQEQQASVDELLQAAGTGYNEQPAADTGVPEHLSTAARAAGSMAAAAESEFAADRLMAKNHSAADAVESELQAPAVIREKALSPGLVTPAVELTAEEVLSTASAKAARKPSAARAQLQAVVPEASYEASLAGAQPQPDADAIEKALLPVLVHGAAAAESTDDAAGMKAAATDSTLLLFSTKPPQDRAASQLTGHDEHSVQNSTAGRQFGFDNNCSADDDLAAAKQVLSPMSQESPVAHATAGAAAAAQPSDAEELPLWPVGVYLTPIMAEAINQHGLFLLLSILAAACTVHIIFNCVRQRFASKLQGCLLPLSVRKDPKKLDAYFALRQMATQQLMWFRLLGVSGAAVALSEHALQQCKVFSNQAKGKARLARKHIRDAVQRLEQEKQQALQRQAARLQDEVAVQLRSLAEAHAAALDAAAAMHQEQQAGLQEQIDTLQKQRQVDQNLVRDLRAREKELAADARTKADVIAEQRATATSLHQQLVEVKSEKAGLSHELRQVRDQLAKEQGRVEAMLHEEQEVKGQAQTVSTKYESLQQQLSEVRSSNAQLTSEVAHLQAAQAAADSSMAELRKDKQVLEEKREQLQQLLSSSNEQLAESRSQSAEHASKLLQLQERSAGQQEQIVALQVANSDLSAQLQQLQGLYSDAQANNLQLQAKLTASDAQVADGKASILELQLQLRQLEQRGAELRAELGESNNSNMQLRSDLQHVQATHATAEASIAELRAEKAAFAAKADQLQQQLTSNAAEVAELRSRHATTAAQLQQQHDTNHALQEQLEATKAKNKRQSGDITSLQQQLQGLQQQLAHTVEQLTSEKQHLQQEIADYQAQITDKEEMLQQLRSGLQQEQATAAGLLAQLQELQSEHSNVLGHCEELDQQLDESMQLLGDREAQLQELQGQKAVLEGQVTALKSNLDNKTATLREAQASLSDTEGKLHEEYEKSFELGRENHALQQELDRLTADNEEMDQELEEALADRAALLAQYEELESSFKELLMHAEAMHSKTEGLLEENLDSRVELAGKLTAAQAGLTAVTQERDELAKKLYWAEIARDQHGAAKALAAADAIAARQALTEEKLLRSQVSSPSPGPGASGGSRHAAAASGDGRDTPDAQRTLARINSTSSTGSKWAIVKPGYLNQNIADRRPSNSSHAGTSSPRSPHANSPSAASAGAASSRSPLGPAPNKCSSAPCTPRFEGGQDKVSSPFLQQDSALDVTQAGQQQDSLLTEQSSAGVVAAAAAAAAAGAAAADVAAGGTGVSPAGSSMCNTGSPTNTLLRRSASLPTLTAELQEYAGQQEQQLFAQEQEAQAEGSVEAALACAPQQEQQQGEGGVAAAAESLRRNFSDSVLSPARAAAAAAARLPTAPESRTSWQQQQQQPLPDSPKHAPPLEVSQSPSIRSSASRTSRTDRSMLPLALSPVPFDLGCSSELRASVAERGSPVSLVSTAAGAAGATIAGAETVDACSVAASSSGSSRLQQLLQTTPAAARQQQQQQIEHHSSEEVFLTPLPHGNPREPARSSCGSNASAATGAAVGEAGSPRVQSTPYFTPTAAVPAASGGSGVSPGGSSVVSSELDDDEADVLIGSMSEADFASVRSSGEGRVSRQQHSQQQSILAAGAAAARGGGTSRLPVAAPTQAHHDQLHLQQQQHAKLSKNKKKKLKQKLKKQAAAAALYQQPSLDVVHSSSRETSLETSLDSLAAGQAAVQQQDRMLMPEPSQEDSFVEYGARSADGELTASLALEAEASFDDASVARDFADSLPKCMLMAGAAAAAAAATTSIAAGNIGRYNSPLRPRPAAAAASSPLLLSSSVPGGELLQPQQLLPSTLGRVGSGGLQLADGADVSLARASSTGSAGSEGSSTGLAASRLRNTQAGRLGSGRYNSPNRTSCSSIKSLVAQSRLRDADSASSGGSSCRSPQRFRAKFGVSPNSATTASPAAAALPAVLSDEHANDVLVVRSSGELPVYRTSVQWKGLSDSLTAVSEPSPGLQSRAWSGSLVAAAVAAAAGTGSSEATAVGRSKDRQDTERTLGWFENRLYFE